MKTDRVSHGGVGSALGVAGATAQGAAESFMGVVKAVSPYR